MKEKIRELISQLDDTNCIIYLEKDEKHFVPALFKYGNKYQIYWNCMSQYREYDLEDLIEEYDRLLKILKEGVYELKLVSRDEFNSLGRVFIKEDIEEQRNSKEDNNLKSISRKLEKYGGTYVISGSKKVKFLIAACSSDEDYYYVYLSIKNGEWHFDYDTCVGCFIPLKGVIPDEHYHYHAVTDLILDKARTEYKEDLIEYIQEHFDKPGSDVLFTPIYI